MESGLVLAGDRMGNERCDRLYSLLLSLTSRGSLLVSLLRLLSIIASGLSIFIFTIYKPYW